ncbi:unnamed protein product [Urochloa decumbens]|uniref:RING-type E3 ubiquitin transferase n=1 Tax=Urochloa decumbens TaxID=240449 RepID=A0ABC9DWM4_9POAL
MAQIWDEMFVSVELVLVAFFFVACLCSACLRRGGGGGGGGARANGGQQQQGRQPRAPAAPVAVAASAPPLLPLYAARNEEQLRAPVVLPHFPYPARAKAAASEPPPACAICLDELRQGQLCSEVPACRHVFHEGCIRAWAKKKNTCPLCRARVVLPRAAYGVAAVDDMV